MYRGILICNLLMVIGGVFIASRRSPTHSSHETWPKSKYGEECIFIPNYDEWIRCLKYVISQKTTVKVCVFVAFVQHNFG